MKSDKEVRDELRVVIAKVLNSNKKFVATYGWEPYYKDGEGRVFIVNWWLHG